jgi:hypothetical protein
LHIRKTDVMALDRPKTITFKKAKVNEAYMQNILAKEIDTAGVDVVTVMVDSGSMTGDCRRRKRAASPSSFSGFTSLHEGREIPVIDRSK